MEAMPIIDIKVVRGTLTPEQKKEMVERVGEAAVAVEGESRRPLLMVGITELEPPVIVGGRPLGGKV
jgi:4-oxalocrotonate tautomerase